MKEAGVGLHFETTLLKVNLTTVNFAWLVDELGGAGCLPSSQR